MSGLSGLVREVADSGRVGVGGIRVISEEAESRRGNPEEVRTVWNCTVTGWDQIITRPDNSLEAARMLGELSSMMITSLSISL
jgi:hypothetical protein